VIYGCGEFPEGAWVELVTGEGARRSDAAQALLGHIEACPRCRAEYDDLARVDLALRNVLADSSRAEAQAKAMLAARIAADAAKARREAGKATAGSPGRSGDPLLRRLLSRPAALAWTSSLVLLLAVASGLLWGQGGLWPSRSTGYTAPGGTILSLAERAETLAAAPAAQGAAIMAASDAGAAASFAGSGSFGFEGSGSQATAGSPAAGGSGGRPIRASQGFAFAVADES